MVGQMGRQKASWGKEDIIQKRRKGELKLMRNRGYFGLSWCLRGKESTCQCRRHSRYMLNSWVRKLPWRRKWQPHPVFLPGESHRQRSLADYSPWGGKSQMWLNNNRAGGQGKGLPWQTSSQDCAPNANSTSLIPGQETKIMYATWHNQKYKNEK